VVFGGYATEKPLDWVESSSVSPWEALVGQGPMMSILGTVLDLCPSCYDQEQAGR
jgi:hypothetical protein